MPRIAHFREPASVQVPVTEYARLRRQDTEKRAIYDALVAAGFNPTGTTVNFEAGPDAGCLAQVQYMAKCLEEAQQMVNTLHDRYLELTAENRKLREQLRRSNYFLANSVGVASW